MLSHAFKMLSHAFNKNMEHAVLLAGDDDFTPLVDELLRHGTYVDVWSDRGSRSSHLVHGADSGHTIGFDFYWHLTSVEFRLSHPFPDDSETRFQPSGGSVVKFGQTRNGQGVKIVSVENTFHFITLIGNNWMSQVRAVDLTVLEKYLCEVPKTAALLPLEWKIAASSSE